MSEPFGHTQSTARLQTDGADVRLLVDYALRGLDETRQNILLRRACAVLADEERRLYSLTDQKAIEELDALKLLQDAQHITITEP